MPDLPSLSFDRAADYYDATRALPEPARSKVLRLLTTELEGRGAVLEVGVGTGRIGLPLAAKGVELTGVDLSEPMLRRLIHNAGDHRPFPLCLADATRLPFASDSFGAVVTCHVLHLIPKWETALSEIARVIRPGGVYMNEHGTTGDQSGPHDEIQECFAREAGIELRHRGANEGDSVDGAMESLGASLRTLPTVVVQESSTYEKTISNLESGKWSWTWQASDEAHRAAAVRVREWAATRYGDLSQTYSHLLHLEWRVYELP